MPKIDQFLQMTVNLKASDLHFSSGLPTRVRIDGDLELLEETCLAHEEIQEIFFEILSEEEQAKLLKHKNLDKSFTAANIGSFRLNLFFNQKGMAAVLRTIPKKIPTLETLRLPPVISSFCKYEKGLVLVTGPTGSGKSTTLASMINHINESSKSHILTVEDPVEFVHESKLSLVNQREIGVSCLSFSDAIKYALREDPDVILIGEMRDLETIALALTAAETGHLVFGTLHTRGAGASIDRIIDSFPSDQQAMIRTMLAESLKAVVSQTLLKKAGGKGRVGAYEIMVVNNAISNLIREGKTFQIPSIMQTGKKDGMVTMDSSIIELVVNGEIDPEEGMAAMENPATLEVKMKGMPKKKPIAITTNSEKVISNTGSIKLNPKMVAENKGPMTVASLVSPPLSPPPLSPPPLASPPLSKKVNMPPPISLSSTNKPLPSSKTPLPIGKPLPPRAATSKVDLQDSFKSLLEEDGDDELGLDLELVTNAQKKTG